MVHASQIMPPPHGDNPPPTLGVTPPPPPPLAIIRAADHTLVFELQELRQATVMQLHRRLNMLTQEHLARLEHRMEAVATPTSGAGADAHRTHTFTKQLTIPTPATYHGKFAQPFVDVRDWFRKEVDPIMATQPTTPDNQKITYIVTLLRGDAHALYQQYIARETRDVTAFTYEQWRAWYSDKERRIDQLSIDTARWTALTAPSGYSGDPERYAEELERVAEYVNMSPHLTIDKRIERGQVLKEFQERLPKDCQTEILKEVQKLTAAQKLTWGLKDAVKTALFWYETHPEAYSKSQFALHHMQDSSSLDHDVEHNEESEVHTLDASLPIVPHSAQPASEETYDDMGLYQMWDDPYCQPTDSSQDELYGLMQRNYRAQRRQEMRGSKGPPGAKGGKGGKGSWRGGKRGGRAYSFTRGGTMPTARQRCANCGEDGHWAANCRKPRVDTPELRALRMRLNNIRFGRRNQARAGANMMAPQFASPGRVTRQFARPGQVLYSMDGSEYVVPDMGDSDELLAAAEADWDGDWIDRDDLPHEAGNDGSGPFVWA